MYYMEKKYQEIDPNDYDLENCSDIDQCVEWFQNGTCSLMLSKRCITDEDIESENKLWKSTDDWNSMNLVRNNNNLYCNSTNEELSDHCYSLEEIMFGNARKSWTVFPGGVGPVPPENFTLTKIYKDSGFGMPTLDFEAMLDDKIFVNKCESNGGAWNYTYHDCEGLWQVCRDVDGIMIQEDITKPCTGGVCLDRKVYRMSCVFEYED